MKFLVASWPKSNICILVCQRSIPCRVSTPKNPTLKLTQSSQKSNQPNPGVERISPHDLRLQTAEGKGHSCIRHATKFVRTNLMAVYVAIQDTQTGWWLNQPIWNICLSKWVHLPQFSGWKWKIYLSWTHHLAKKNCKVFTLGLKKNLIDLSHIEPHEHAKLILLPFFLPDVLFHPPRPMRWRLQGCPNHRRSRSCKSPSLGFGSREGAGSDFGTNF